MRRGPRTAPTTSGCRRALQPSRNSTQAVTARQKSVSSRSNQFASAAVIALLAACHSAPPKQAAGKPAPVAAAAPSPSAPATPPAAAANATPGGTPPGGTPPAPEMPIPPRAAQQYAQALQMMKAGRGTDTELEFKQLAVAYPQ